MTVGTIPPPPLFGEMSEVRGVLTADLQGAVIETTAGSPESAEQGASTAAATVAGFTEAGSAAGFGRLELLLVKGVRNSSAAAVRSNLFLQVTLDPTKSTAQVEKVLHAWASETAVATATPPPPVPAAPA